VKHGFDWSWWNDAGKLLKRSFKPFPWMEAKLIKKKDKVEELQKSDWESLHYERGIRFRIEETE
jgi:hypothetical protein